MAHTQYCQIESNVRSVTTSFPPRTLSRLSFFSSLLRWRGRFCRYTCPNTTPPSSYYGNNSAYERLSHTSTTATRQVCPQHQLQPNTSLSIERPINPTSTWQITVLILHNGSTFPCLLDVMSPDLVSLQVFHAEVAEGKDGEDQR
jgi:hypothetical protein